ncbi:MAG: hypothetical protein HYY02_00170 [Chloroflexi bacterium]|nr:hypothetical protein [Chloroflexota bacterium]
MIGLFRSAGIPIDGRPGEGTNMKLFHEMPDLKEWPPSLKSLMTSGDYSFFLGVDKWVILVRPERGVPSANEIRQVDQLTILAVNLETGITDHYNYKIELKDWIYGLAGEPVPIDSPDSEIATRVTRYLLGDSTVGLPPGLEIHSDIKYGEDVTR